MLEPKSRLFHAIVVMGLGVTGCGSEPAPVVDASLDTTQPDVNGNDTSVQFGDGATDAPSDANSGADVPVGCPSACGGPCPCFWCPDAGPDAWPCYV
jgi:hypothetical protein